MTSGVRVRAKSFFVPAESSPERFIFAYRIRFVNEGPTPVQLRSRHWTITDGRGRVSEVTGPGVVGETPILAPGQAFAYTSFTQLPTPAGFMAGEFSFVELNPAPPGGGGGGGGAAAAAAPAPAASASPAPSLECGAAFDVILPAFGLDERDREPPLGWDAEES